MYFVDRQKLEQHMQYMEQLCKWSLELNQVFEEPIQRLAMERLVHMQIEVLLDIGNLMIDGFIMRDPGSYEDILVILEDEKVIDTEDKELLLPFILCRKELVSDYMHSNHDHIWHVYKEAFESLKRFPQQTRRYLEEQLGPVSAFTPKS
ncbi:DUF86 domain-containing protein [Bacillus horti]|uniref:Uncharacterized protein YutE (UPF0331/DUF86 family) n=1 Tax=Caldalkalibacillus horti TaxID=77523 RepID=A0ABT9VTV5_9BACI|nr:DUF86 domain-containing protein [Bacillus horti]MDQ0164412.1 uncharacterized protein YutE (UPF0331/DUF86 family) [Bacillus horti]